MEGDAQEAQGSTSWMDVESRNHVQAQKAGELQQCLLNNARKPLLHKFQQEDFAALLNDPAAASSFNRCLKLYAAGGPELPADPAEAAAQLEGMLDCLEGKVGLTLWQDSGSCTAHCRARMLLLTSTFYPIAKLANCMGAPRSADSTLLIDLPLPWVHCQTYSFENECLTHTRGMVQQSVNISADPHCLGSGHPSAAPQRQSGGRGSGVCWTGWPPAGFCPDQVISLCRPIFLRS